MKSNLISTSPNASTTMPTISINAGLKVSYLPSVLSCVESHVHKKIVSEIAKLRERKQFVYDRVPDERIDQYQTWRTYD